MAQKLTLTGYLKGRGSKALTRIEAEVFGIPYPLRSGWPAEHAELEITSEMLEQLSDRISTARQSTASKARRGLCGVTEAPPQADQATTLGGIAQPKRSAPPAGPAAMARFPGFVLRMPRRLRRPAPWKQKNPLGGGGLQVA